VCVLEPLKQTVTCFHVMVQLVDDFIFLRVTHVTTVTKSTLSQGCGFSYVLGTAVFNVLLESYMRGNEDGLRKNNFNLM